MITNTRTRLTVATAIALTFATVLATAGDDKPAKDVAKSVDTRDDAAKKGGAAPSPATLGVLLNDSRACPGFNLINPGRKQTYLYDNEGRVVHSWTSDYSSGAAAYLLDNGHLFRPAEAANRNRVSKAQPRAVGFKNSIGMATSSGISSITAKSACPTMTRSNSRMATRCSSAGK